MRPLPALFGLAVLLTACGGEAIPGGPVVLTVPTAAAAGKPDADRVAEPRMDPLRDCRLERESFERLARSGRADPAEIREALGVAPDFSFQFETLAGDSLSGAEYRLRGPRVDAPFYEAFGDEHEGESYYVFYERGWFQTRAVECGFQRAGMYGGRLTDG